MIWDRVYPHQNVIIYEKMAPIHVCSFFWQKKTQHLVVAKHCVLRQICYYELKVNVQIQKYDLSCIIVFLFRL